MTFRNTTTATNQILGRIAGCQHHAAEIKNPSGQRSVYDKPLEFEPWFKGLLKFNESQGYTLSLIEKHGVRGIRREKDGLFEDRKLADFYSEWRDEYCVNFYL